MSLYLTIKDLFVDVKPEPAVCPQCKTEYSMEKHIGNGAQKLLIGCTCGQWFYATGHPHYGLLKPKVLGR